MVWGDQPVIVIIAQMHNIHRFVDVDREPKPHPRLSAPVETKGCDVTSACN